MAENMKDGVKEVPKWPGRGAGVELRSNKREGKTLCQHKKRQEWDC